MSATRPGQGTVVVGANTLVSSQGFGTRTEDGSWRVDAPFTQGDGLKITMRRAQGVTDPKALRVPLRFQAPVTDDFRRAFAHPWARYDTLRAGQRSRPMGAELMEVPISTLLLDQAAQDASSGVVVWPHAPNPQKALQELRFIAGVGPSGKRGPATPFRLTINQPILWGDQALVNMLAVLTRVEVTERPGHVGTEFLELTFLEFVEDEVDRRRQPRDAERTRYHDLRAGDTLHALASRYYHQPSAWKHIATANGIRGVRPGSAAELAAWAKKHSKKRLRIPPFSDSMGAKTLTAVR